MQSSFVAPLKMAVSVLGLCLALSFLAACTEHDSKRYPESYFPDIPDFPQEDPASGFVSNGKTYCAPVSVSNSLVWLEGNVAPDYQRQLIKKLASSDYMSTSWYSGTSPAGVVRGVARYLEETGQQVVSLKYAGRRTMQSRFQATQALSKAWLIEGLGPRSAVWLNVGWYESPFPGYYRRVGGHWVVLVGYQQERFLIHDSGRWAGPGVDPQALEVEEKQPLLLRTEHQFVMPTPAVLEMKKARSPMGEHAFIDGAIILKLAPRLK